MGALDDAPHVLLEERDQWRAWLEANHDTAKGVWLVTWRRASGRPRLEYEAAVEEALCFGWIDSQGANIDEQRSRQYFAPRKRGSPWAATNKVRVAQLAAADRMAPAGLAVIDRAKADDSWTILDSVERLEVPADLAAALDARPPAGEHWRAFPPSARKQILAWIAFAKRPETRARRITTTAEAAQRNERAIDQTGR